MLRAAIKGPGNWGKKLIASVQDKSSKISFVSAITRRPGQAHELQDRFGLSVTDDYEAVLRDPSIDAIVLATPHSQHAAETIAAAKAGKHIFAEKPFTLTRSDAEAAIAACEAAGITLQVGFNRRFAPAYLELSRRIAAGEIGQIRHIEGHSSGPPSYQTEPGNWRANRKESPGGSMTARGVHILDSMTGIAGPVDRIQAMSVRQQHKIEVDDTTACLLHFANGVTGYLGTLHATAPFYRLHVFGSEGALEMRGETELIATDLAGKTQTFTYEVADKERAVLESFADAVAQGVKFPIPARDIINGVAVLEAITTSAESNESVAIDC